MTNTITSNYMYLPIPVVGTDPGPDWANNINNSLQIIDYHNHSLGHGNQINSNGININADFPINAYNLTLVKTVNFSAQGTTLPGTAPNLGCIYVADNELVYNDRAGNIVPITKTGSVNSGAGSINGLPSGTASATYSAGNFLWQSATNTSATLDCGSILMRNSSANSKALTLNPPAAMPANFSLTLPILPAHSSFMVMDQYGNMSAPYPISLGITGSMMANQTVTNTQIANATITTTQIAASANIVGSQLSSSAGIIGSQLSASAGIVGSQLSASAGIVGSQLAANTLTGSQITSSVNLPGNTVQENGRNVVVSGTNASASLAIVRGGVATNHSIFAGEGFTITDSGTGYNKVTYSNAFADIPVVTVTVQEMGVFAQVTNSTSTFCTIFTRADGSLSSTNATIYFIAIGQR